MGDLPKLTQPLFECDTFSVPSDKDDNCIVPVKGRLGLGYNFYQALINNDLHAVEGLLETTPSLVNKKFTEPFVQPWHVGQAGIHVMVKNGVVEGLHLLIRYGAQVDLQDKNGDSALHLAAMYAHHMCTQVLLDYDLEAKNQLNQQGLTPLLRALVSYQCGLKVQFYKTIKCLVDARCDCNVCPNVNLSPLHLAINKEDPALVHLLVKGGANVNAVYTDGQTPLSLVVSSDTISIHCVKLLLDAGACPDVCNLDGSTPLHIATERGDIQSTLHLLAANANPNVRDHFEQSPLWIAVHHNNYELSNLLVQFGAEVNFRNRQKKVPLVLLPILAQSLDILELLLKNGAKIRTEGKMGQTPLYLAVGYRNLDLIRILLRANCELDIPSNKFCLLKPMTPIQYAFELGDETITKLLIRAGCPVKDIWLRKQNLPLALQAQPELEKWILKYVHNPLSLAHTARLVIRHISGDGLEAKLYQLAAERKLPAPLIGYVMLDDLL